MKTVHRDNGHSLMSYQHRIYVEGPKGPAWVEGAQYWCFPRRAQLRSLTGVYRETWTGEKWNGPIRGEYLRFCPDCGKASPRRNLRHDDVTQTAPRYVSWSCPCGNSAKREINWYADHPAQPPADPYFGYPLLLQTSVAGQVLWAYNEQHLIHLRDYIAADLRERPANGKWSMVARLPAWMKLAKNRSKVLRGLRELEEKIARLKTNTAAAVDWSSHAQRAISTSKTIRTDEVLNDLREEA